MNLTALRASARRKISYQAGSTKYPDTDLDANLNEWYRLCLGWMVLASGRWEVSGDTITTNLAISQSEYTLPSTTIRVHRVEVLYPDATDYVPATVVDDQSVPNDAFANSDINLGSVANPVVRFFDNSIFLYPAPTANVTNGLKVEVITDITDLSSGSDIPAEIPVLLHRTLATGAAYDFCSTHDLPRKADRLYREIFGRYDGDPGALKTQVEQLAAQRDRITRRRFVPRFNDYS